MRQNRSFVFFRLVTDFDPRARPGRRRGRPAHAVALDRGRPDALELRAAVLDRGRASLAGRGADPLPAADDRAGHRLGDCRTGPRRHILRQRRRGGRAAQAASAIEEISPCSCPSERSREGRPPAPPPAAPERRGDRALDRGRPQRLPPPRREPADGGEAPAGQTSGGAPDPEAPLPKPGPRSCAPCRSRRSSGG